jgi:arsenate reductase (glutaredoxin)
MSKTTTVTIYHNPLCGTSRKVLEAIRAAGVDPQIVEYLKTPPSRERLAELLRLAGLSPRQLLRRKEAVYAQLSLDDPKWRDDELIGFMADNPILIERPLVVTGKGARLCRPAETVNEILA